MSKARLAASALLLCVTSPSFAQERCLAPTPVRSLDQIKDHTLALVSKWGPSFIGDKCTNLRHGDFGPFLQFNVIPPTSESTTYVYIKSYRTFSTPTVDKIKVSRGGKWFSDAATAARAAELPRMNDEAIRVPVDKWNEAHVAAASPDKVNGAIGKPWHAYADPDKGLPSTDGIAFWQTGDFDFSTGTQTSYVIRVPANSRTPIPFNVGHTRTLGSFRLEIYSNIDALSNQSFRFVFKD